MLPNSGASPIVKFYGLIQIIQISLFCHNMVRCHYQPEMVVGMDPGQRLPAFCWETIMVTMAILILLRKEQIQFILCPTGVKRHHSQNVLRRIPYAYASERTCCVIADIPGKLEIALCLIRIPHINHGLGVFIRQLALEFTQKFCPLSAQRRKGFLCKVIFPAMGNAGFNSSSVMAYPEDVYSFSSPAFRSNSIWNAKQGSPPYKVEFVHLPPSTFCGFSSLRYAPTNSSRSQSYAAIGTFAAK